MLCMQEAAQATIIARVAYVLLNIFILSTVFRCSSDADSSSSLAYTGGFAALVLLGIALYIALNLMDPGFSPVTSKSRQQVRILPSACPACCQTICLLIWAGNLLQPIPQHSGRHAPEFTGASALPCRSPSGSMLPS